jgi:hypothetical protein
MFCAVWRCNSGHAGSRLRGTAPATGIAPLQTFNLDKPAQFEVSSAEKMLEQL